MKAFVTLSAGLIGTGGIGGAQAAPQADQVPALKEAAPFRDPSSRSPTLSKAAWCHVNLAGLSPTMVMNSRFLLGYSYKWLNGEPKCPSKKVVA